MWVVVVWVLGEGGEWKCGMGVCSVELIGRVPGAVYLARTIA